uniref:hypothetical protein n=1 Tax=Photorhabdus sp. RM322S TaxID=3342825 RepID=UPI0036DE6B6A
MFDPLYNNTTEIDPDPDGLFEMGQLGKISPVAWQPINFYGRFEFNDIATTFSVDEFVKSVDLATLFTD